MNVFGAVKPPELRLSDTIGTVVAVGGATITGLLEGPAAAVRIGALVKIAGETAAVYGVINGLKIDDPSVPLAAGDRRMAEIELVGEIPAGPPGTFRRGVSQHPMLGQAILPVAADELAQIYARPKASNVPIGTLHQDAALPAHLLTDELLGKHFAVLGTTGAGKSCAVALILRAILGVHPHGHVILLDPHNEYAAALGGLAEVISTGNLKLPYWLLNFEELAGVLIDADSATREAESDILKQAVLKAKASQAGGKAPEYLTVDTPVPYRITEVVRLIDEAMGKLDKADTSTPYLRLKGRIETLRGDRRFGFMFAGLTVSDSMAEILTRLFRIPVEGRPVTIIDLSGVPSEIVDVVVSVIARMSFDFALWSGQGAKVPLLLVCEEAHRYIPRRAEAGFGPTRAAIARIAKEGRKYGVALGLVTQRPSELSETILSQCNTLFALRMGNRHDQEFVARALPDGAQSLLDVLPALRTQEAIVVGEGVALPVRIRFSDLAPEHRPRSVTVPFSAAWSLDGTNPSLVTETIDRWRRQSQ